jgi:hypothetical protein
LLSALFALVYSFTLSFTLESRSPDALAGSSRSHGMRDRMPVANALPAGMPAAIETRKLRHRQYESIIGTHRGVKSSIDHGAERGRPA